MLVINVVEGLPGAVDFFKDHGFYVRLAQYEMFRPL
jgi:hypothetical protein